MSAKASAAGGCTHNCSSCAPGSCDTDKKGINFFGTLGSINDKTNEMGDEEFMKLLEDTVAEWGEPEKEAGKA